MPRRKVLHIKNLEGDRYVDRDRYEELRMFCKQYESRNRQIQSMYGLKSVANDGMPHGTEVGNPTESAAVKIDKLKKENDLIQECIDLLDTDSKMKKAVFKNVTLGIAPDYLDIGEKCIRTFYYYRRTFYSILSEKR